MKRPVPEARVLRLRKQAFNATRAFFDGEDFLEVETPIAVTSPGMEPHLEAFETRWRAPNHDEALYLHTSPEYAMKRLLGAGHERIYQLARVFRDGEHSRTHAPEFTMLEWYRQPGTLEDLMDDTEALIEQVADAVDGPWRPSGFRRCSVSEAFLEAGLRDPFDHEDAVDLARALGVREVSGDTWDDVFHRAMFDFIEPSFDPATPVILWGYPASMAALSKIDPDDPRRCLRFEVFIGGVELANAFAELTDPEEQRRRFEAEQRLRASLDRPVYPIDEDLLTALTNVDDAAGIALGIDRLLMVCDGAESIEDIIPFSPRSP